MLFNKGDSGCQWRYRNWYCPKCKVFGYKMPHEQGCDGTKVMISSTARIPRKNASKKVWDEFYRKFVSQEDLKEFLAKPKKESNSMKTWKIQLKLIRKNKQYK